MIMYNQCIWALIVAAVTMVAVGYTVVPLSQF